MSYLNCQSCGMPLNKDVSGGGTNSDGSINGKYCGHCYSDGSFTTPDITLPEMKERVKNKMAESGVPKFMAGLFTLSIHKLERWK